jgi:hypothetical protein
MKCKRSATREASVRVAGERGYPPSLRRFLGPIKMSLEHTELPFKVYVHEVQPDGTPSIPC